jgi:hypothetical protein
MIIALAIGAALLATDPAAAQSYKAEGGHAQGARRVDGGGGGAAEERDGRL